MTDQQTPETSTDVEQEPVPMTVTQYRAKDDPISEHESRQQATAMLREKFRAAGMSMLTDPVASAPVSVRLRADGTGWDSWDGPGRPDGQVITWSATGIKAVSDPEPLIDGMLDASGDSYSVPLPDHITKNGGSVRIRHGLGGDVLVKVFGLQGPMGYLFNQTMTPDEEHVEVMAGATFIRVEREKKSIPTAPAPRQ